MTETEQVDALLQKAVETLEKGWTRGHFNRDGRFCLVGALAKSSNVEADGTLRLFCKAFTRLNTLSLEKGFASLTDFNDAQTSKVSVIALVNKAIEGSQPGTPTSSTP